MESLWGVLHVCNGGALRVLEGGGLGVGGLVVMCACVCGVCGGPPTRPRVPVESVIADVRVVGVCVPAVCASCVEVCPRHTVLVNRRVALVRGWWGVCVCVGP